MTALRELESQNNKGKGLHERPPVGGVPVMHCDAGRCGHGAHRRSGSDGVLIIEKTRHFPEILKLTNAPFSKDSIFSNILVFCCQNFLRESDLTVINFIC